MESVLLNSKNVLFWNDPLLLDGYLEIYLTDDVTVKLNDFFICTCHCVRNALVHSYEKLKYGWTEKGVLFACCICVFCNAICDVFVQCKTLPLEHAMVSLDNFSKI